MGAPIHLRMGVCMHTDEGISRHWKTAEDGRHHGLRM